MTLVMDGVRRSGGVRPAALGLVVPVPSAQPRPAAPMAPAAMRYVTGMDGIRRPVAMPTPREVLGNLAAPALATAGGLAADMPPAALQRPWRSRPVVAFGLVAAALVAAGATASIVNTHRPITAAAETSRSTAASKPAAAGAAAQAVAQPTPNAAALAAQQQAGLQNVLNDFMAAHAGSPFNIVVKDLKTGATASINPDQSYTSASLYKLFVAQQIYRQIDTGQLSYNDQAGDGTGRNIQDCLNLMITISDNGCGRALGSILGWSSQNSALHNAGYTETDLATPQQTSARNVALLFERLYNGTLNSPNSNDAFLDLLKAQKVNNRLPQGLPVGTVIAHKTGDLDGVVHDGGIVYGPKTDYLVVAMSGSWNAPGNAPAQFADLSQRLWNFFE